MYERDTIGVYSVIMPEEHVIHYDLRPTHYDKIVVEPSDYQVTALVNKQTGFVWDTSVIINLPGRVIVSHDGRHIGEIFTASLTPNAHTIAQAILAGKENRIKLASNYEAIETDSLGPRLAYQIRRKKEGMP